MELRHKYTLIELFNFFCLSSLIRPGPLTLCRTFLWPKARAEWCCLQGCRQDLNESNFERGTLSNQKPFKEASRKTEVKSRLVCLNFRARL